MNFESNKIQVFPTSKRSDAFDRNARLNSEQNLISIVNRLTSLDSFVIDGLAITDDTNNNITLSAGTCNIHGYLFKLLESVSCGHIGHTTGKDYLCLVINTTATTVGTTISTTFRELDGLDDEYDVYTGLTFSDDSGASESNKFKLKLAKWDGEKWVADPNRFLKYAIGDVKVNYSPVSGYPATFTGEQNLEDWLANNYVIDDGEIE